MDTRHRAIFAALAVTALAGVITLLILLLPGLRFAYANPRLAVALATAEGLIATMFSFLAYGRFRRTEDVADLVLLWGFAMLALSNLVFGAIAAIVPEAFRASFLLWAPRTSRLLGAAALLTAAWMAGGKVRDVGRGLAAATGVLAAGIAVVAAAVTMLGRVLPPDPDPFVSASEAAMPHVSPDPATNAIRILTMLCFGAATVAFARRADRTGDRLMGWLAIGTPLAAFAALNQLLFSSALPGIVYVGDAMRLSFYGLLLIGGALEVISYWSSVAEARILEERRRMARDLHDGLAQELAFIVGRVGRLRPNGDHPEVRQIRSAAERALDESRRAIAALTRPVDEPLDTALQHSLGEIQGRLKSQVHLDLAPGIHVSADVRETVLRIAREAVSNADRHGGASSIEVRISNTDGLRMTITDDGRGFDPEAAGRQSSGFGLISMRERAEALGARLEVTAAPGSGARIEMVLP